ncbi:DNA-binding protein (plasmid) [Paenibacillus larvae subsp. pulvifaciens]|uniref:DNA-binding protein n=1 Tax=Paenibacillus larvae subsp. pulvifaciens TaxID=1477 RepID=A0A1V0V004_9BACL|nr:HU family DNA-binding protein [Paenibacillus larvae]ARF70757.1 DNA-binding protein [Paenibacillus larvae subsp. pulvifaciens]
MAILTKDELVNMVKEVKGGTKADAKESLEAVVKAIETALENGNKVRISGFGNFEVRERSARTGRNPQTGEEMEIPEQKTPAFKASVKLKEKVRV